MSSELHPTQAGDGRCAECGRPLPNDAPGGLCPACLVNPSMDIDEPTRVHPEDSPTHAAFVPRTFANYELLEEIARGGMGVVYRARQKNLNRVVALKMILAGPFASRETILRFRAEAEAAANLRHPNIVAIHETGEEDGQHFFSMEYVDGRNLAELVRDRQLPYRKAATYLTKVAEAVHYAHEHSVLHRDLKPSNVLIDREDEPRITDFGLAKRLSDGANLTVTGQVLGSPGYMPPEQAFRTSGHYGPHSDIYALGAILYHLLTGRPPFQAETLSDVLDQLRNSDPVPPRQLNPSVPIDLETVCLKCLEKAPAQRYATARQVADELNRFLRDEPVLARPVGGPEKLWRWAHRNPVLAGMGLMLALLLIGVSVGSPIALVQISHSRAQARKEATTARQSLYAADLLLVQESYRDGNVRRAIDLLLRHRPNPGEPDLRDFSWRYLWRLCQEGDAFTTAAQHQQSVNQVAWSASGLLASAGSDGVVQVYDSLNARSIANLKLNEPVNNVAFSPAADALAIGDTTGQVQLWTVNPFQPHTSHQFRGSITALAFSPDGRWLAVSAKDDGIKLWGLHGNSLVISIPEASWPAIQLTFSRDGRTLAAGGKGMPVRLWSAPDFQPLSPLEEPHSGYSTGVAFSPDGQWLATASWDTTIKLWDLGSRTLLATLKGHLSHVWDLDISPNGRILASASNDGTVKLWLLDAPLAPEIEPWRTLRGHTGPVLSTRFDVHDDFLASGSADRTAKLWRVHPAHPTDVLPGHKDWVYSVALSPDDRYAATGSFDGKVRLWETATLSAAAVLDAHRHNVFAVAFLPGHRLVSCDAVWRVNERRSFATPGNVNLWDLNPTRLLTSLPGFSTGVRAIAVSTDGYHLATGDHDGAVRIWDISHIPPRPVASLPGTHVVAANPDPVRQIGRLQFSPDGTQLAVLRRSHSAEVWGLDPLRLIAHFTDPMDWNYALAFSPDGRCLVGGQEEVRIWDIATAQLLVSLKGHEATVMCAAFSPDSRTLATGSVDHSVKLWHLDFHQEVATLRGHTGPVSDVVFSRDNNLLLSASEDMTARIWRATPSHLIAIPPSLP